MYLSLLRHINSIRVQSKLFKKIEKKWRTAFQSLIQRASLFDSDAKTKLFQCYAMMHTFFPQIFKFRSIQTSN